MVNAEPFATALESCADALRALAVTLRGERPPQPVVSRPDRLLNADEAATILGVNRRWLYRNAPRLPFTRHLSRKALRFSEVGLRRWIERRQ
jgi:predicted DNA-binding transcriptional regulator AlpA